MKNVGSIQSIHIYETTLFESSQIVDIELKKTPDYYKPITVHFFHILVLKKITL